MIILEMLYRCKKTMQKWWRDYFTIEGRYTSLLPDKIYLKQLYKKRMKRDLNLKNPVTYNEKLQWLKLYDRRKEYTTMVDKYKVRNYVAEKIGKQYLIPLLGCWDRVEQIDFMRLPEKFVLKCNHDNGVIICKDKERLDIERAKRELQIHLNRNYYKKTREWAYKHVKRKIICEKFMSGGANEGLIDYKFFCFDGKVKGLFVATGRPENTRFDFFDREYNHLSLVSGYPNADVLPEKPKNFGKMIEIAEILSEDIPHVRVDLYNLDGQIYFGEMTFYHDAGLVPFEPEQWDKEFGTLLILPPREWRI